MTHLGCRNLLPAPLAVRKAPPSPERRALPFNQPATVEQHIIQGTRAFRRTRSPYTRFAQQPGPAAPASTGPQVRHVPALLRTARGHGRDGAAITAKAASEPVCNMWDRPASEGPRPSGRRVPDQGCRDEWFPYARHRRSPCSGMDRSGKSGTCPSPALCSRAVTAPRANGANEFPGSGTRHCLRGSVDMKK